MEKFNGLKIPQNNKKKPGLAHILIVFFLLTHLADFKRRRWDKQSDISDEGKRSVVTDTSREQVRSFESQRTP